MELNVCLSASSGGAENHERQRSLRSSVEKPVVFKHVAVEETCGTALAADSVSLSFVVVLFCF